MAILHHFFAIRLLWSAIIAIIGMASSQLLGRYSWQLELFSHYVPHVALLVLLATVIYPKPQHLQARLGWLRTALALLGVFLAMWSLQPWSVLWQRATPSLTRYSQTKPVQDLSTGSQAVSKAAPIRIVYQNVNIGNPHPDKAISNLVAATDALAAPPDVVALVEAGGEHWQKSLDNLARRYPTHCGANASSPFAMQVYAIDAAATCEMFKLQGFALAKITLPKLTIAPQPTDQSRRVIYVVHPPPPITRYMAQARNAYLSELATLIKADNQHSIMVVGDFNLSAFSPLYRDFIRDSATADKPLQRTTLTGLPTWLPFGIGIDQVLVNNYSDDDADKIKTQALSWAGSDHRGFRIVWH